MKQRHHWSSSHKYLTFHELHEKRKLHNVHLYADKFDSLEERIDKVVNLWNERIKEEISNLKYLNVDPENENFRPSFKAGAFTIRCDAIGIGTKSIPLSYLKDARMFHDELNQGLGAHNKNMLDLIGQDLQKLQDDFTKINTLWEAVKAKDHGNVFKNWLTLFPECKAMKWEGVQSWKSKSPPITKTELNLITGFDPIVVKEYITQASMEGVL